MHTSSSNPSHKKHHVEPLAPASGFDFIGLPTDIQKMVIDKVSSTADLDYSTISQISAVCKETNQDCSQLLQEAKSARAAWGEREKSLLQQKNDWGGELGTGETLKETLEYWEFYRRGMGLELDGFVFNDDDTPVLATILRPHLYKKKWIKLKNNHLTDAGLHGLLGMHGPAGLHGLFDAPSEEFKVPACSRIIITDNKLTEKGLEELLVWAPKHARHMGIFDVRRNPIRASWGTEDDLSEDLLVKFPKAFKIETDDGQVHRGVLNPNVQNGFSDYD